MTDRYLLAQGQRRILKIQDKASIYRGEVPAEQGAAPITVTQEAPAPAQQFVGTLTAVELEELKPWLLAVALDSSGNTDLAAGYLAADVVKIHDDDDSHELSIVWNETETSANRTLNLLVNAGNRTIDLSENLKVLDGQDIELHASGGEKAQLAIDTQNAERTLTLNENLTIGDGTNITITGVTQANTLTLYESLTLGDGYSGTLTFSAASKVLTVEGTSVVNQDLTTDANPTFASCSLGTGELTCGSINRASGTLTLEIGGAARISIATAVTIAPALILSTCAAAGTDTNKFLVLDASGNVDYRTGTNVLADLSGDAGATFDWNDQQISNIKSIAFNDGGATCTQVKDEDSMATDSATMLATQQSIKAYADTYKANKTTAAWSKSIAASGGDYTDWATMIAAMPDLIAHAVTVTIEAGTTLTETCELKNKHGITKDGAITIQAEKYFPTSGAIPTADSATATTLRDAALATAAVGNDYFNGCWIIIVDGTGTDNGFVPITDYVDATGDVVVSLWPGTEPDNTSRYLIVGALIDCGGSESSGFDLNSNSCTVTFNGIGITDSDNRGIEIFNCFNIVMYYCAIDKSDRSGFYIENCFKLDLRYSGLVGNNTDNNAAHGGIYFRAMSNALVISCGISDNNQRGIYCDWGSYGYVSDNFGDANGAWGVYAYRGGQANVVGAECSGATGNHSDSGTADTASDDQASAFA